MKTLGIISAVILLCTVSCCGMGMFITASLPQPEPTVLAKTKSELPSAPSTAGADDEVDRIFSERTEEYKEQLADWEAAKVEIAAAKSERKACENQLAVLPKTKPSPPPACEPRQWSTANGKFKTLATLIDSDNLKARLRKANGKEIEVSKDLLSEEDLSYSQNAYRQAKQYKERLVAWNQLGAELREELSGINKRIELEKLPEPTVPDRSKIKREHVAEVAIAQAEREKAAHVAKAEAVAIANAKAAKLAQDEVDAYAVILRVADPERNLITKVSAKGDTLTLTVANIWHFQPYQVRLQSAQNLWEGWANLHSPSKQDKARLSLVDLNGNKIGGSRVWGGSLIWVQEK